MTRLPDWERRLADYIASVRDRPFQFGQHDCILFATAAAAAQTGTDVAADYRGQYDDKPGAAAILKRLGKGTLLRTINATFAAKKPSRAGRGDIVWFEGSAGVCLGRNGLFVGEERLAEKAGVLMREGLVAIPRALWTKAWHV